MFLEAFSGEKGEAVWRALKAKGWIVPHGDGSQAGIRRSADYGLRFFNGPLAPLADEVTKQDHGDSRSSRPHRGVRRQRQPFHLHGPAHRRAASPGVKAGNAKIRAIRSELEHFLDDQQEGYAPLYDARAGMFSFGWDASRDQLLGWQDEQGNWRKATWTTWATSSAAPRLSWSCVSACRFMRCRTWASRSSRTGSAAESDDLRAGPLGWLGVPGPGTGPVHGGIAGSELEEDAGKLGRRGTRLRRSQPAAGLPLRIVHRRRRPIHRRGRNPGHRR